MTSLFVFIAFSTEVGFAFGFISGDDRVVSRSTGRTRQRRVLLHGALPAAGPEAAE